MPGQAIIAGLVDHNIQALLELVEIEFLGHDADVLLGGGEILVDIHIEHRNLAAGLGYQGADDADGGGLSGAIGAQQRKKVALLYLQADALEGLEAVVVDLAEVFDGQCWYHVVITAWRNKRAIVLAFQR